MDRNYLFVFVRPPCDSSSERPSDETPEAFVNLHHLRIFYTVAQRRSVTAAAADLLLSQPAVSLQLKALRGRDPRRFD